VIIRRDLGIGSDIGQRAGLGPEHLEVFTLVEEIYNRARVKYGEDGGSSLPAKLLQDELDESLSVAGFEQWKYTIAKVASEASAEDSPDTIAVVHQQIAPRANL
jgi:hypothetical protein